MRDRCLTGRCPPPLRGSVFTVSDIVSDVLAVMRHGKATRGEDGPEAVNLPASPTNPLLTPGERGDSAAVYKS